MLLVTTTSHEYKQCSANKSQIQLLVQTVRMYNIIDIDIFNILLAKNQTMILSYGVSYNSTVSAQISDIICMGLYEYD